MNKKKKLISRILERFIDWLERENCQSFKLQRNKAMFFDYLFLINDIKKLAYLYKISENSADRIIKKTIKTLKKDDISFISGIDSEIISLPKDKQQPPEKQ
jgi:hypothetical protein